MAIKIQRREFICTLGGAAWPRWRAPTMSDWSAGEATKN
jgi:hypothetical protein